jgi:hypothetical protein
MYSSTIKRVLLLQLPLLSLLTLHTTAVDASMLLRCYRTPKGVTLNSSIQRRSLQVFGIDLPRHLVFEQC